LLKVLITGSNGFIGQHLSNLNHHSPHNYFIVNTYRHLSNKADNNNPNKFSVGNIDSKTQWQAALTDVNVVVHLAARVNMNSEPHANTLDVFRTVNTQGTLNLAKQAAEAGVKRFVYLSTIKVNGEQSKDQPFHANNKPDFQGPYAESKFEAEEQLTAFGKESGLEIVIIRPPLVYGPMVKGNFSRLIQLVRKSIPLPLARIHNARSLVYIQNLCSLIETCLIHPNAAGEVFLVSDGKDLSTTELFDQIALALNKKSHLFYIPKNLLKFVTGILGRHSEYQRLFGSLQVDITKNEQLLGWRPEVTVEEGIRLSVKHSLNS